MDLWTPILLSLLAGLSTGLGGSVVLFMDGEPSKATMCTALSLAGAVMVYVSVELAARPIMAGGTDMWIALGSLCLGALSFLGLQQILPHAHLEDEKPAAPATNNTPDEESPLTDRSQTDQLAEQARFWRLGMLMLLVLTAHNFPEGMAVAVSALDSSRMGILVAVAVAAHNIPEGIVIAVPVYAASKSKSKAIGWALLSGLTEPLGAIAAVFLLRPVITENGLNGLLCLVAGMMLAVSVVELFPSAWAYNRPAFFFAGCAAGAGIMCLTDHLV